MGISWDEARGIMERAVARGLADRNEPMSYLAVDEKSYRNGRKFITLLMDLLGKRIYGVSPGHSQKSLETLLKGLKNHQINGVEAIAMDMHDPYKNAVKATSQIHSQPLFMTSSMS